MFVNSLVGYKRKIVERNWNIYSTDKVALRSIDLKLIAWSVNLMKFIYLIVNDTHSKLIISSQRNLSNVRIGVSGKSLVEYSYFLKER